MQNTRKTQKPVEVNTPGMSYSFYREKDADLTTMEGRTEWFCLRFEVEPPKLEYDPEEPDAILLTDELLRWTRREGVSLDWLICGSVTGAISVYRDKHKLTEEGLRLLEIVEKLSESQQEMLIEKMKEMVA